MVELDWIARIGNRPVGDAIRELHAAGMDSCPGGGAEIFAKRVRDIICTNKISGERWLEVARECHRQGVRTNATMLYGHVETAEERVDHLLRLRELQEETGGIPGLIPLAFHPENTPLADLPSSTGQLDLRVIAASRLLLDNVPHVKAYWIQIGVKLAQVALHFGADDLVGTVVDETITHAAGGTAASGLTRAAVERGTRECGRAAGAERTGERTAQPRAAVAGGDPIVQMAPASKFQNLDDPPSVPLKEHSDPPFRGEKVVGVAIAKHARMYPSGR